MTMKNFDRFLSGTNTSVLTPACTQTVVITEAKTKYRINTGNALRRLKASLFGAVLFFSDCFARTIERTSVIGMMARVRVSLTVTALSSVWFPRPHMLSQVDAAAVTEEVSLTAVPAKIPKASPLVVSKPMARPRIGKKTAARTLKKKITEIACATSSSSAPMTGAVAAIAEPPQIEEPTPTSVEMFPGTCISRCSSHAMISEVLIVQMMIGRDCFPVSAITPRSIPNPSRTTAVCRIYLEVHRIPPSAGPLFFQNTVTAIPTRIPMTAPPTTGKRCPMIHDGMAIARHRRIPAPFFLINDMIDMSSLCLLSLTGIIIEW